MGKSPGKWLKSVLFGKKSSRSHSSKGRDPSKATGESKGPVTPDSPVISHPLRVNATRNETEIEIGVDSPIITKAAGILSANQDTGVVASAGSSTLEKFTEERAAIKAQAAFRGYLARRAFRALRGIIRLQALIRGHLVRRQAVATLRCMQAIVKLQALARGEKDAKQMNSFRSVQKTKLSTNNFFCKLLSSKPTVLPLQMHYVHEEPNSARNWLERWTFSQFWKPLPPPKKTMDYKSQRNGGYAMETESGRSKRTVRRSVSTNAESGPTSITIKHNIKKVVSTPAEPPALDHPQSELEKVKHNLRKISNSMGKSSDQAEMETEKPRHGAKRASSLAMDVPALEVFDSAEKTKKNNSLSSNSKSEEEIYPKSAQILKPNITTAVESSAATELHIETTPQPSADAKLSVDDVPEHVEDKALDGIVDDHLANLQPLNGFIKDKNHALSNVEETSNEEQVCQENQKTSKRRASLSAKPEYQDDGMQNTPTLPRYMQATDSAKAKLRGLSSPRFSSDGIDKNSFTRRHSLPSPVNERLSSKIQKQAQTNGRGIRTDRSFDKPIQVEWKR